MYTTPGTATVAFAAGVRSVDLTFTLVPDADRESLETFVVQLENPVAGRIYEPMMATVFVVDETGKFECNVVGSVNHALQNEPLFIINQ